MHWLDFEGRGFKVKVATRSNRLFQLVIAATLLSVKVLFAATLAQLNSCVLTFPAVWKRPLQCHGNLLQTDYCRFLTSLSVDRISTHQ